MELLAYKSTASEAVDGSDVFQIVAKAARNNAENEITGVLLFSSGRFMQFVEGPSSAIDALMGRIKRDNRHSQIAIIARTPISQREFPRWSMKRLDMRLLQSDTDNVRNTLLGLNVSDKFVAAVTEFFSESQQEAA